MYLQCMYPLILIIVPLFIYIFYSKLRSSICQFVITALYGNFTDTIALPVNGGRLFCCPLQVSCGHCKSAAHLQRRLLQQIDQLWQQLRNCWHDGKVKTNAVS